MPADIPRIDSRQNPRVKHLVKLRDGATRRKLGQFLIEGAREVRHALEAGVRIEEGYFCPELFVDVDASTALVERAREAGAALTELSSGAFEKVSLREGADGILAVGLAEEAALDSLELPEEALLLVVEAVEKPGNLGALLRTADAAGVHAVICCDPVTDRYNPNVIRSSQGLVFALPLAVASVEETTNFCRRRRIRLLATTPYSETDYWAADFRGACAVLLGGEKDGLSPALLDAADARLRIPMAGQADSLNVSTAAAVVLFEAVRQRG
ncbi:MAG: TrmH family RNA methyltransferase [Opitutales bacterium]